MRSRGHSPQTACDRSPPSDGTAGGESSVGRDSSGRVVSVAPPRRVLQCLLGLLLVPLSRQQEAGSAPSVLDRLCAPAVSPCYTGLCYTVGRQARCLCDPHYSGPRCATVRMDAVTYDVIGSVLIFKWRSPPRMRGYAFVYYELRESAARRVFYKRDISMRNNENSVIVGVLKGGGTHYNVCIEEEGVAERAVRGRTDRWLTSCKRVVSPPDYHTLAGFLMACVLCTAAVVLVYTQREKFELMYFNNKYFLPRKT